jgi:periplasmic protein TonB
VTNPPPPPEPPPPPPKPVRLHAGMQAPVKIVNVDPFYPSMAQTARVKGVVILEAIIDERGSVKSVSVLRSIQLLDQAAVDAVRKWRFTPARLNGEAVPVVMTVTVNFELDR